MNVSTIQRLQHKLFAYGISHEVISNIHNLLLLLKISARYTKNRSAELYADKKNNI